MSENEIKPVAWRCIWSKSGKPAWEQYHDESDPMPEQWGVRPNEVRPLYGQSAIDRLMADARGFRAIADEVAGMLEDAEDRIDRLTAERDALREQLDWAVRENDRLLDEGRDSAAEISSALDVVRDAMECAYHNRFPECCGQYSPSGCCGNLREAWSKEDQSIMDALHPVEQALAAMLAARAQEPQA